MIERPSEFFMHLGHNVMKYFGTIFYEHNWIIQVLIVLSLTALVYYLARRLYIKLFYQVEKSQKTWAIALLKALKIPLRWLIWIFGVGLAVDLIRLSVSKNFILNLIVGPLYDLAVIYIIVWTLLRFVRAIEQDYIRHRIKKGIKDHTTVYAVAKIVRIVLLILMVLIGMQTFGIPIAGVLAFGGFGGIAVGFAAKDILSNILGGLMVYFERPFSVGEWIKSPDRNIEGMVEEIGWRSVLIRTPDKQSLYVPNGVFGNIIVQNVSRMTHKRMKTNIGLRYQDAPKIPEVVQEIETMCLNHKGIDLTQTFYVALTQLNESALNLELNLYTKTTDNNEFYRVQQNILLQILSIFEKHQVQCAFPTQTLDIPQSISVISQLQS